MKNKESESFIMFYCGYWIVFLLGILFYEAIQLHPQTVSHVLNCLGVIMLWANGLLVVPWVLWLFWSMIKPLNF